MIVFSLVAITVMRGGGGGSEEAGLVLHGNIICGQKGRVVLKFSPAGVSIGNQ